MINNIIIVCWLSVQHSGLEMTGLGLAGPHRQTGEIFINLFWKLVLYDGTRNKCRDRQPAGRRRPVATWGFALIILHIRPASSGVAWLPLVSRISRGDIVCCGVEWLKGWCECDVLVRVKWISPGRDSCLAAIPRRSWLGWSDRFSATHCRDTAVLAHNTTRSRPIPEQRT